MELNFNNPPPTDEMPDTTDPDGVQDKNRLNGAQDPPILPRDGRKMRPVARKNPADVPYEGYEFAYIAPDQLIELVDWSKELLRIYERDDSSNTKKSHIIATYRNADKPSVQELVEKIGPTSVKAVISTLPGFGSSRPRTFRMDVSPKYYQHITGNNDMANDSAMVQLLQQQMAERDRVAQAERNRYEADRAIWQQQNQLNQAAAVANPVNGQDTSRDMMLQTILKMQNDQLTRSEERAARAEERTMLLIQQMTEQSRQQAEAAQQLAVRGNPVVADMTNAGIDGIKDVVSVFKDVNAIFNPGPGPSAGEKVLDMVLGNTDKIGTAVGALANASIRLKTAFGKPKSAPPAQYEDDDWEEESAAPAEDIDMDSAIDRMVAERDAESGSDPETDLEEEQGLRIVEGT